VAHDHGLRRRLNVGVNCPRVLNWSNPNVNVGSDPTGTAAGAQQEDNHRTLNNTALTVANFRCSSPGCEDVWMKDTWSDTGQEPDPAQAALPMWESPYIWVQNTQDTQLIHQHEHMNPIKDQQNFIYVKIHNGGAATSGNLEVRVASASVGLTWPADWTLISSVPVASFAAHSTRIIEVPWTPTVEGHHCLIARWVSGSDPMTTPEGSNIEVNVRGNNNIVWHNVNVVKLGGDSMGDAVFLVQNARKEGNISLVIAQAAGHPAMADVFGFRPGRAPARRQAHGGMAADRFFRNRLQAQRQHGHGDGKDWRRVEPRQTRSEVQSTGEDLVPASEDRKISD
jgi:hypothetical protein